ncbi:hypothetical protein EMPS_03109 [Entomortierella parvispora]|uniref:Single-stranded DNA binding protein Ssb-like OB fold domain-containing protein n=1 Tax=Entomortierella parvispora TaxID=205924 RepID=A0A9P3H650_9FUNG|nr:hypothetical protein EMPS_03109 [Entomortierella parvispora]
MATTFVNVASLVPDQRNCNLKLRVLSVEAIAETIHPETGKMIQSAEAIVGDDTACILLNLKNDQVNLLARNARLQLLNAKVNMYCGFMRLQVDEEDESINPSEKPSITAIQDGDEDGMSSSLDQDGDQSGMAPDGPNYPRRGEFVLGQSVFDSAVTSGEARSAFSSTTSPHMSSASISSGSSSTSLSSQSLSSSTSSSPSSSRDQLDVEMRLGTGGSVPLMEYYRTIEFTYFSTVEPVGR